MDLERERERERERENYIVNNVEKMKLENKLMSQSM